MKQFNPNHIKTSQTNYLQKSNEAGPASFVHFLKNADEQMLHAFYQYMTERREKGNKPKIDFDALGATSIFQKASLPNSNGITEKEKTIFSHRPAILQPKDELLKVINAEIDKNLDNENFKAVIIAKKVGLCSMQLYRRIKKLTQLSPANYIRIYRLHRSLSFLNSKKYSISQVGFMTGFRSLEYFSRSFKKEFGICPSEYRASVVLAE